MEASWCLGGLCLAAGFILRCLRAGQRKKQIGGNFCLLTEGKAVSKTGLLPPTDLGEVLSSLNPFS